jgi:hypothetical protein
MSLELIEVRKELGLKNSINSKILQLKIEEPEKI